MAPEDRYPSSDEWEDVDVPQGAYMSWASRPGQRVVGLVIDYEPHEGRDFADQPCPLITLRLRDATYAVNKDGDRRDFAADEMIMVNCALVNLKKAVKFANLERGNLVDIHFYDVTKVDKGDAKQFKVRVMRKPSQDHQRATVTSGAPQTDDPPF